MGTIQDFFSAEHRTWEDLFTHAEEAASAKRWADCAGRLQSMRRGMLSHFDGEESELFSRFEEATGMVGVGPTAIMRDEHEQIRALLDELGAHCEGEDRASFLAASETLGVLLQQHHMKEEGILLPMCDQVLADQAGEIIGAMAAREGAPHPG